MNDFDLHIHSSFSGDGQYSPEQLVELAYNTGLHTISLTDHDSVLGVPRMMAAAKKYEIKVIPGIECSTLCEDYSVHVLGYGININNSYFKDLTKKVRKLTHDAFFERAYKMIQKYDLKIDIEDFAKKNQNLNLWDEFCKLIFHDSKYQTISDFVDYIPGGKRSDPASVNFSTDKLQPGSDLYVRVEFPDFKETICRIHEAGGIAVIAHPFRIFYKNEERLLNAIKCGIDGIEAFSNYHEKYHNLYYAEFAKKHDLIITCGSDFHGKLKPSINLGEYGLNGGSDILNEFLKRINEHK